MTAAIITLIMFACASVMFYLYFSRKVQVVLTSDYQSESVVDNENEIAVRFYDQAAKEITVYIGDENIDSLRSHPMLEIEITPSLFSKKGHITDVRLNNKSILEKRK